MRQGQKSLGLALLLGLAMLQSCGERAPDIEIADPRAYAIERLATEDLRVWWQPYRNPDPKLIAEIVDAEARKKPEGLPTAKRELEGLVDRRLASRYRSRMEDSDEGKAFILARAEERFADPPTKVWDAKKRVALLDYHVLPGTWKSYSRLSEGLKDPPAIGRLPFLNPDVMAQSLQRMIEAHPKAEVFQLRYAYHHGSGLNTVLMQIVPDYSIVYREGARFAFTAGRVPWKDLLAGQIKLEDLDWDQPMEGRPGPKLLGPPREIIPLER